MSSPRVTKDVRITAAPSGLMVWLVENEHTRLLTDCVSGPHPVIAIGIQYERFSDEAGTEEVLQAGDPKGRTRGFYRTTRYMDNSEPIALAETFFLVPQPDMGNDQELWCPAHWVFFSEERAKEWFAELSGRKNKPAT